MVSKHNLTDNRSRCDDVVQTTSTIRGIIGGWIHEAIVTRFFHCSSNIRPFEFLGNITLFRHGSESKLFNTSQGGVR